MSRMVRNERGMALVLVLLIAIAVTALAMGGIVMTSAGTLTSKFHYKELALQSSADGGAELGRDSLNRNSALLPDSGYVTLQSSAADMRKANSANHEGDGQNVLFADGHVEFVNQKQQFEQMLAKTAQQEQ